ncbi:LLM class flavin-dependent oxidoreductase [Streptomyces sp. SP18CS02]|uniref:LLM class flavin-dependent oxidoreductase n=1 Tax=Streptomyces sp. SP18CS02 TaxID=3002531 RepID=UPI002E776B06|nr:LLM class flavin-dependent oxidoreductase [Streptomyces sp. SP18CS02]MEE1757284.1 LLM class flavin-dependent oxidoreductase [Streptomyces sp. SP18CS02]
MKFGIWLEFRNPPRWKQPWPEVYEESLSLATLAETAGFESVWMSEHHLTADGYLPSVFPPLAAIAARTERIRLGTAMVLASLQHPLRLAEDAAVTDLLTAGRLELGIAPGYREQEFRALGIPRTERGARTDETVEILRKAWTGEPFTHEGRHFSFDEVTVTPRPHQSDLPLWVGGGSRAAAIRAGRYGCHFLPDLGTPPEIIDLYRSTLAANGHDPAAFEVTAIVTPGIYVCDDAEKGWAEVKEHYHYLLSTFMEWFGNPPIPSADDLPRELFLVGPPDVIAEGIQERVKALGDVDRVIFFGRAPGLPIEKARRSLERFAEHVIPRFA